MQAILFNNLILTTMEKRIETEKKGKVMVVANPIYDTVFKFLMEDERIARTILSALLKRDIVRVEVRPHEYSNTKTETISIFRIDFAATIREVDGSEQLILIELQKTWLPTETLRFRQYLGVQYESPKNIVSDSKDQHALPMVAVYLLGHKVGDIEEPVIYVRHQAYDYNEQLVTKGIPNAFIDSLTHDSIIVQIPRLHGKINNRLDEVLSFFDQSRQDTENQHFLNLDDSSYAEDDLEIQRILRRLLIAAADTNMRMDMNVEDEYYSIIESRDTDIMLKTRELAEQTAKLKESNAKLEESIAKLEESNTKLEESKEQLKKTDETLKRSIRMLIKAGQKPEEISTALGIGIDKVYLILNTIS